MNQLPMVVLSLMLAACASRGHVSTGPAPINQLQRGAAVAPTVLDTSLTRSQGGGTERFSVAATPVTPPVVDALARAAKPGQEDQYKKVWGHMFLNGRTCFDVFVSSGRGTFVPESAFVQNYGLEYQTAAGERQSADVVASSDPALKEFREVFDEHFPTGSGEDEPRGVGMTRHQRAFVCGKAVDLTRGFTLAFEPRWSVQGELPKVLEWTVN